ncbi:MAG TPA: family 1 encapsulin nanocompartment shell protein [Mycobacteriales bacterium]|nr:family 1 encapsulin nanocompartment shell protein [Mycobacteriales bacterium]
MNHLLRGYAPITEDGWELLDQEASERLGVALGARRLVDFSGPNGWGYSATNLGRTERVTPSGTEGITVRCRKVLPLSEVRADFVVLREELLDFERGAQDTDLDDLDAAALRLATAENTAVFHGWSEAGIVGITEASSHPAVTHGGQFEKYPECLAQALEYLRSSGVGGPYALALGPADYKAVAEATERGYPLLEHIRKILDGPIVWAPGVRGGVVLSRRGGDYLFESGQDLAIGYDHHDAATVHLYIEETFSFRVATAEAAVAITR